MVSAPGQFLDKGLEQSFQTYKGNIELEIEELATVQTTLRQEFPQKDELALMRENHAAVIRKLKRIQDGLGYVSAWEPKTELDAEKAASAASMRLR
jgi:hypothetical protein